MAQSYDGDIQLSVGLSLKDATDAAQKLSSEVSKIFDNINSESLDKNSKKLLTNMNKTQSQIEKVGMEIDKINNKLEAAEDYSKEYEDTARKVSELRDELLKASEAKSKLASEGFGVNSDEIQQANQNIKDLTAELNYYQEKLTELSDNPVIASDDDVERLVNLKNQLGDLNNVTRQQIEAFTQMQEAEDSTANSAEELKEILSKAGDVNPEIRETVEQFAELEQQIERVKERMAELEKAGAGLGYAEYDELVKQLSKLEQEYTTCGQKLDEYRNKLRGVKQEQDSTSTSTNGLSGRLSNFAQSIGASVGKFALLVIGINSIKQAFSKVKSAIMEGISSMAQMNNGVNSTNAAMTQLTSSLSLVKGALATAFQPILTVVAPILSSFMQQLANVITMVGMFIAKLTGATSFTKATFKSTSYAGGSGGGGSSGKSAQEKYDEKVAKAQAAYDKKVASIEEKNANKMAKAEEKEAKAAGKLAKEQEKANGKLAAFDDLNVLGIEAVDDMEDALDDMPELLEIPEFEMPEMPDITGGGGGGEDPFGLEEVPLDGFESEFLDFLKDLWDSLVDGFQSAWDRLDLDNRLATLKDYFRQIKDALKEIFDNPEVRAAFMEMMESFMHMLGSFAADLISIGVSIATFIVGGIAQYLSESGTVERIQNYLKEMFTLKKEQFEQLEKFGLAIAEIFKVLESPEALKFSEDLVGIFAEAFMNVTLLIQKFITDFIELFTQPIIDNVEQIKTAFTNLFEQLDTVLSSIRTVLDDFGQRLNTFYDEHVHPLIQSITNGLSDLIRYMLDLYNNLLKPFIDILVQEISELVEGHIGPMLDAVIDFLEPVIDLIKMFWENVLVPFFAFVITEAEGLFAVLTLVLDFVVVAIEFVIDEITSVLNILTDLLQFIEDIFTVGWEQAWDNLREKMDGWVEDVTKYFTVEYWEGLAGNIVDGLKKGLSEGWENFKDDAGAIGKKIINKFREDTDTNSPSKKAEDVGIDIISGLFLPFNEQAVQTNVTPFAQSVLEVLRTNLTGESITTIGTDLIQTLIDSLTASFPLLEEFLIEQFSLLTVFLIEQFTLLIDTVFIPVYDMFTVWFEEQMQLWWDTQVKPWMADDKWQAEIYTPWFNFLKQKWNNLDKWWNDTTKKWFEELKKKWEKLRTWWDTTWNEYTKKWFEELKEKWNTLDTWFNETWDKACHDWFQETNRRWHFLIEWWDDSVRDWWENHVEPWLEKIKETLDELHELFIATTDDTFTQVKDIIIERVEAARDAVIAACAEMIQALQEVLDMIAEVEAAMGGISSGGGGGGGGGSSSGGGGGPIGGGGPRSFMPMLEVMHFEDNLGMSAFKFPELATGAVIPPNNKFLAVLGDQKSGTNIETPLNTMLEAFRMVMDEYGGANNNQTAVMEVDGETFARLMLPYVMDEMHRQGYNTEIIEGT